MVNVKHFTHIFNHISTYKYLENYFRIKYNKVLDVIKLNVCIKMFSTKNLIFSIYEHIKLDSRHGILQEKNMKSPRQLV